MKAPFHVWHDLLMSIALVAVLAVVSALAEPPQPAQPAGAATPTPPQAAGFGTRSSGTARPGVDDAVITNRLTDALINDATLLDSRIAVLTLDGVVLLRGVVRDQRLSDHAARLAAGMQGVRAVENQLAVAVPLLT